VRHRQSSLRLEGTFGKRVEIFLSDPNAKKGHRKMRLQTPLTAVGLFPRNERQCRAFIVHCNISWVVPDFVHATLRATDDPSPP
jgi:hypothetical protein